MSNVDLQLTAYAGNVVLFAVLGSTSQPPGPSNYQYTTEQAGPGTGSQVVTISSTDPLFTQACPDAAGGNNNATCRVSIAVLTTSVSSAYTIVARASTYLTLANGSPVADTVGASPAVNFYRYVTTGSGQVVTISVAVTAGDPVLYVGADTNNATTQPRGNVPGSYIWASATTGDEVITIDPSTDPRGCNAAGCAYYIGVASEAVNRSAAFVLLGRRNS
jgi:hypothetical protein